MAGEPIITVIGNATAEAELRYTPAGVAVCSFTVASTPRVKQGDQWTDGESTFYRCSLWRQPGEVAAESITRGMRLIVHGRLKTRSYEKDGQQRTSIEIDVEEVGPSLRYATAKVTKASRDGGSPQQPRAVAADDPWASAPVAGGQQAMPDDEPPF